MGNLEGIEPRRNKKTLDREKEKRIKQVLETIGDREKNVRLSNFKKDPIHDLINFLAKNEKRKAEKILKKIRKNIKPEQYITKKQEEQILNDFLNEKDQII